MSESILNALMHLFAIVANLNKHHISKKGRGIVESYLNDHLSKDFASDYMKLFDDYLDFYNRQDIEVEDKTDDVLSSRPVAKICQKIKADLHRNERMIVLMRLLEYIQEDEVMTLEEERFIHIVADVFSVNEEEFDDIKAFIFEEDEKNLDEENVLVIQSEAVDQSEELEGRWVEQNRPDSLVDTKHLIKDNLEGKLIVLRIKSIRAYALKYTGTQTLFLEGRPLQQKKFYFLNTGSIIKCPKISPIYFSDIHNHFQRHVQRKAKIVFSGRDVEFRFKNSKNGIRRFNFSEESAQLIGIMGGSGVGKSTLMNILNGTLPPTRGVITINEFDLYRDRLRLEGMIGYVPQDDLLIEELTVFENLLYNAQLCFRDYTNFKILDTVQRILRDLDLEDIKDLQVGSPLNKYISGGQRKRLNIALELMREPSVLFVDEPTSGLSSRDSEMVMLLLKEQTLKGKLVIVNIHQPSSEIFKLLDKLWVLDKGGYPIYNGNPIEAVTYFKQLSSHVNAAEVECSCCGNVKPEQILQIIEAKLVDEYGKYTNKRKVSPKDWYKSYKRNIESKMVRKEPGKRLPQVNFKIPDLDKQFIIFFNRNFAAKLSDKQYWVVNLLEAPLLAFILGYFTKYSIDHNYVFSENKSLPVFLFMSVVVALFIGLTVSAEEIIKDRKILKREAFLNLSLFSYLNSKIVYLFGLSAFQAISFVLVGHLILEIDGMLWSHFLILFSTSCFANLVGLNISAGLKSVVTIYIMVPLIMVPQLLLGGAMIKFDDLYYKLTNKINVPIIGDVMVTRWAYEALSVQQFSKNKFQRHFFDSEQQISNASFNSTLLIPRLINKLEECVRNFDTNTNQELVIGNLKTLRYEIKRLSEKEELPPFEYVSKLDLINFDEEVAEETNDYLTYLRFHFRNIYDEANERRDSVYRKLTDSLGHEAFLNLQRTNHNNAVSDLVLNRDEINRIFEIDHKLIQKKDPIYHIPDSKWGRAHFYAPVKNLSGRLIPTFWFNLTSIWLLSAIFYVTLLTDALRKLLEYFEKIKIRRENK